MTITGSNHGLSVVSSADACPDADTADNRRLRRPVATDIEISNCFNAATTGHLTPGFSSGHEGIDFEADAGTAVIAMYGGVVTAVKNDWPVITEADNTEQKKEEKQQQKKKAMANFPYGNSVTIRSCTDPATKAGFEHRYGHLSSAHKENRKENGGVQCVPLHVGTSVAKGELIGRSGQTGHATGAHLHVHLKPFTADGVPNWEFKPVNATDEATQKQQYPPRASRISGCMDFACFLPADPPAAGYPNVVPGVTVVSPKDVKILLSPRISHRDAHNIPVYRKIFTGGGALLPAAQLDDTSNVLGTISGRRIGCYNVVAMYPEANPAWYRIHFATGPGWVSRTPQEGQAIEWVRIEEAPSTAAGAVSLPYVLHDTNNNIRTEPSVANETTIIKTPSSDLQPSIRKCYVVVGQFYDSLNEKLSPAQRLWWQIELGQDATAAESKGWVRSDIVWQHGDTREIVSTWVQNPWGPATSAPPAKTQIEVPIGAVAVPLRRRPDPRLSHSGVLDATRSHEVVAFIDADLPYQWYKTAAPATAGQGRLWARSTAQSAPAVGWVQANQVRLSGSLVRVTRPPFARVTAPGAVPLRPGPALGYTEAIRQLTATEAWYEIVGHHQDWWQLRVDADTVGWLRAQEVDTAGETASVPFMAAAPPPTPAEPEGPRPPGHAARQARGHYLNLALSWGGTWAVSKAVATVTASFQSTRSPVQYLARQNPTDLLVLPVAFRPTTRRDISVTGYHTLENGAPFASGAAQRFTLRVEPTGAVRYVNGPELDHVGFLSYEIGTVGSGVPFTWTAAAAVTTTARPTLGALQQRGDFLNRAVHWAGYWDLRRVGDRVAGTVGSTRSAVQYAARQRPQDLCVLPAEFRPASTYSCTVTGARHVNEDGSDHVSGIPVAFDLTVTTHGTLRYVDNSKVDHVGYLRYTVAVAWTADPRVQVPEGPRDLEAEDVEDTSLELDWDHPEDDGGARIEGYRIEIYRSGRWRTAEANTDSRRTRYNVSGLSPHTHYSFRVSARNAAGWGPRSAEVAVTTRREAPGMPRRLAATATHAAVTLRWQAASGTVTGYQVQRRTGRGSWRLVAADTGSAVTHFVDRAVTPATTYSYAVRATHYGEAGIWSSSQNIATAMKPTVPGRPTDLTVEPGSDSQLQLRWTAPTAPGSGISGYRVERSPDATPRVWTEVAAHTHSIALNWGDNDVAADTLYHYRVSARNSAGVSAPSQEAQGQSRPQLRLNLLVVYPLTAHAEPRATAPVSATFGFFLSDRSYDLLAQVPGADGWWRIRLPGATMPGPFWLPAIAGTVVGSATALPRPPAAPMGLTATRTGGQVVLAWQAPTAGATVTGYRLWRQCGPGSLAVQGADLKAIALTATDRTAAVNVVCHYRLQALSAQGPGPLSESATLALPSPPGAVGGGTVHVANGQVTLSWTVPATDGGRSILHYRVRRRLASQHQPYTVHTDRVADPVHTEAAPTVDGIWHYSVQAVNALGAGPWSNPETSGHVLTMGVPPGAVGGGTVHLANGRITLSWTVPTTDGGRSILHYRVRRRMASQHQPYTVRADRVHGTTHTAIAPATDGTWYYSVQAVNALGASPWSNPETSGHVLTVGTPPGAVGVGTVDLGEGQVVLTWAAPATDGGRPILHYRVRRRLASQHRPYALQAARVVGPLHTETAPTVAGIWYYSVQAVNALGAGPWSNPETNGHVLTVTTPPGAVEAGAVRLANGQVVLTWAVPVTDGGQPILHYRVRRRRASHGQAYTVSIDRVSGTAHTEAAPTASGTWYYSVQAVNVLGAGPWSNPEISGHVLVLPT